MMRRISMGLLVAALGLGAACGGNNEEPTCTTIEGFDCHPGGFPFVEAAAVASDLCGGYTAFNCPLATNPPPGATTATLTQPQAGTVCLSGTVAAGGWAQIVLQFAVWDKQF